MFRRKHQDKVVHEVRFTFEPELERIAGALEGLADAQWAMAYPDSTQREFQRGRLTQPQGVTGYTAEPAREHVDRMLASMKAKNNA